MYISIFLQLAFSAQHCLLNWSRVVHLEMLLAPVCIPLAQVWCQPVAWAALCQLRPLPKTTYQLKHKPFLFLFAPSRADTHGCPTQKFGRINASVTGEQELVASSVLSFSRARQRHSAYFSRGASRTELLLPTAAAFIIHPEMVSPSLSHCCLSLLLPGITSPKKAPPFVCRSLWPAPLSAEFYFIHFYCSEFPFNWHNFERNALFMKECGKKSSFKWYLMAEKLSLNDRLQNYIQSTYTCIENER